MSALMEQLSEDMSQLFKEKWLRDKKMKWRSTKNKPPDPNKIKEIWIRDTFWEADSLSEYFYYENDKWNHKKTTDDVNFSRFKITFFEIWFPNIDNNPPEPPSEEFIEKYRMKN